jgi:L-threonylcarbamoyladenylate synthase
MYHTIIGKDIKEAARLLEKGELVAIPTETVYGLAGNGLDPQAIAKIYEAKNRPQFNPLILHVANEKQLGKWVAALPEACSLLMQKFSPGPITYLLPKSDKVPDLVTAGSKRVALRIPNHPLTLSLLSSLDFPLAAPSANPSGYVSPVTAKHVMDGLGGKIPYILDGGDCSVGLESTIVGFEDDHIVIHRLGVITAAQIIETTGIKVEVSLSHAAPTAPGQLKRHYATRKPFLLGDISSNHALNKTKKIGLLLFEKNPGLTADTAVILSPSGDLAEAAAGLFSAMRKLDAANIDIILAERFPEHGIGLAINDRLERAAFKGVEEL